MCVGDNYACRTIRFVVGPQATANTTPTNTLTVNETLSCSGRMYGTMFFCAGKVDADGIKAVSSPSSFVDFVCSVSGNVYQTTFGTSHPAGANYVIQVSGQGAAATVSSSIVPTATGFRVVIYFAVSTWPTGTIAPCFFTLLY